MDAAVRPKSIFRNRYEHNSGHPYRGKHRSYVKEPTFAKAMVGGPASAKASADAEVMADKPARQALAHLREF